jgi:phage shock protein PspC (stress-responsive transcriptional regulator)
METTHHTEVNGGEDTPRRLRREPGGRLAGVCEGLGRYLGIDPNIVRILFVLAAFAGGAGIAAYVAAWVLVPTASDPSPEPFRLRVDGPVRAIVLGILVLVVGGAFLRFLWAPYAPGPGHLVFGAVLVAAGLIVLSQRPGAARIGMTAAAGPAGGVPAPSAPGAQPAPFLASWRNRVTVVVAGLLGIAGVAAALAALTGAFAPSLVELAALAAAVPVVVIVAMAFLGLGRMFVPLGGLVALAGLALALPGPSLLAGAGQRQLTATSASELAPSYALGAGDVTLDLRALDLRGESRSVRVRIGAGEAHIIVPPNTDVQLHGAVSAGQVLMLGRDERGLDASLDVHEGAGNASRLVIDAEVGYGRVFVER